jgi:16S rRNA (adenine1518-N6/adenine1519-N6)-dimethyltransferase
MCAYQNTRQILAKYDLAPAKSRGQNFLKHARTAESIVACADFSPADCVIEVGVGIGALTIPLAARVNRVIGIEVDRGLVRYLETERILPGNVQLLHQDVLKTDFHHLGSELGSQLKVIANLPYSISNPFLFRMLDFRSSIEQVVVMLQKEVADRLSAAHGSKEYGIPTVLFGCCARVEKLMRISPEEFHPRPKVESQLIRIHFHDSNHGAHYFACLQKLVRAAFNKRRKTLLNNLCSAQTVLDMITPRTTDPRGFISEIIHDAGLDPAVRAEAVDIDGFSRLARRFCTM